jgi:hypothetical protein
VVASKNAALPSPALAARRSTGRARTTCPARMNSSARFSQKAIWAFSLRRSLDSLLPDAIFAVAFDVDRSNAGFAGGNGGLIIKSVDALALNMARWIWAP